MSTSNHHGWHGTENVIGPCLSKSVVSNGVIHLPTGQREGAKLRVGEEGEDKVEDFIWENAEEASWTKNGSDATRNYSILAATV